MLLRVQFLYKGGLPIAVQRCFLRRRKNGIVHSVWLLSTKRVPIALKQTLKKELDQLSSIGVIQRVDTPTGWISALILSTKNQAFHRNHLPLPMIHDVLLLLSKVCVFTVLYAKNGFWHIQSYELCSIVTTFGIPWGICIVSNSEKNFRSELIWHLKSYKGRRL